MSISLTGLDRVLKKIGLLETLEIMEPPMQRSLIKIENKMKDYPSPPAQGEWAAKTSRAQKRAFFALLRAGLIKGKREGTLGRRWTVRVDKSSDSLEGHAGNNTTYGPYVQSKRFQARFHQGRWATDAQVLADLHREIVQDFEDTAQLVVGS